MRWTVAACAVAVVLIGCDKKEGKQGQYPQPNFPQAPQASSPSGQRLTGKVLERLDGGSYVYLKLQVDGSEQWAAISQAKVAVGEEARIEVSALMENFESKALGRTFPAIYFGVLAGDSAPTEAPTAAPAAAPGSPEWAALLEKAPPKAVVQKVEKAPGPNGRTIAEVHERRTELDGKKVVVRGKVVKVSTGIMDRNWIHLQDGTGSADKKTEDLTITSQADVSVGEVVMLEGTVRADKDIGAGYFYKVLVEDAVPVTP